MCSFVRHQPAAALETTVTICMERLGFLWVEAAASWALTRGEVATRLLGDVYK